MLGTWISYWNAIGVVLISIILWVSMVRPPTRRGYLTAAGCLAILSLGWAAFAALPMVLGIRMASAFGPTPVAALAYLWPVLVVLTVGYPALSLFPALSAQKGRKFVVVMVGLVVVWSLGSFVLTALRWPQTGGDGPRGGMMALCYLLLWFRVYDLRSATGVS